MVNPSRSSSSTGPQPLLRPEPTPRRRSSATSTDGTTRAASKPDSADSRPTSTKQPGKPGSITPGGYPPTRGRRSQDRKVLRESGEPKGICSTIHWSFQMSSTSCALRCRSGRLVATAYSPSSRVVAVMARRSWCQSMGVPSATASVVTLISSAGAGVEDGGDSSSARPLYPFQNVVHTRLSNPTMKVSRLPGARDTAATCWFT